MSDKNQKSDWDIWIKEFLKNWLDGFMQGIDKIEDEQMKKHLFDLTGRSCAESHTKSLFKRTWKEVNENFDAFLPSINKNLGGEFFKKIDDNKIQATYNKCLCPLVNLGLADHNVLCNCSPNWLKENFEAILKKPVEITTEGTVLRGQKNCKFTVEF